MALKTTTKPFAWGKNYNRQKSRQQIEQTLPTHGRDERLMPLMRETATEPGVWRGVRRPETREGNGKTAKAILTKRVPGGEWDKAREGLTFLCASCLA